MRFSFFTLAFLSACNLGGLEDAEKRFCGFEAAQPGVAGQLCEAKSAFCPKGANQASQGSFCKISYPREEGFWLQCAPSQSPICGDNACHGQPDATDARDIDLDSVCSSFYLSSLVLGSIESIHSRLGNQAVVGATSGDVQYVYYPSSTNQWLAFRTSITTCNWMTDLNHEFTTSPKLGGIRMHRGFLAAAESAVEAAKPLLDQNKGKRIRLTGHSLGGSVAAIAALLLAADGYQIDSVAVFGQPQFTDEAGAVYLKARFANVPILRVINHRDAFSYAMFVLDDDYAHFGPELRLEPSENDPKKTNFALLTEPEGFNLTGEFDISKLTDHLPNNYAQRLNQLRCSSSL